MSRVRTLTSCALWEETFTRCQRILSGSELTLLTGRDDVTCGVNRYVVALTDDGLAGEVWSGYLTVISGDEQNDSKSLHSHQEVATCVQKALSWPEAGTSFETPSSIR